MSKFPLARILDFVARVVPFDSLDEETLTEVVRQMEIAYFPKDEQVIKAGSAPAENLYIIHSGSVEVTVPSSNGNTFLVDLRGEGDVFGAVSILSSKKALFSVTSREDLLTFLLPAEHFRQLVTKYQAFQQYFSYPLARNFETICRTSESLADHTGGPTYIKQMADQVGSRVTELMSSKVLTCGMEVSIREAAQAMNERGVGSIIVVKDPGQPVGILTDTDLRSRVLAAGLSPETRVEKIMSQPPLGISHNAFAFEAMLEMTRHGVHHLVVYEGERMVGVISDHDIKLLTGLSPVVLARDVDKVSSLDELEKFPQRLHHLLDTLLRMGGSAEYMMDLITEVIDRLTIKLFYISEKEMERNGRGAFPVDFIWLSLDYAGRREQAPPMYQSHALLFQDVPPEREESVRDWFLAFARQVSEGLAFCGGPACPYGLMAREPSWCQSAGAWEQTALGWVRSPEEANFGAMAGFFDFRPVLGESSQVVSMRKAMLEAASASKSFSGCLARAGAGVAPPLGFLRQSVVERGGGYLEELDLLRLLTPMIGAARALAWQYGIGETNTLSRLSALASMQILPEQQVRDLRELFSFITIFRISQYLHAQGQGRQHDDLVDPAILNGTQRKIFKEGFALVADFRERLLSRYALRKADK